MIWRHYPDTTALDAQFTLDGVVDLPGIMQRRLEMSAAARDRHPHVRGVAYGDRPEARMDLFPPPPGLGPAPVLVFIHGGFWRSLDAATFSFVGGAFAPHGALVAVLDYPLIPQVRLGAIVDHVRAAVAWLVAHAAEHGGDPGRIHVAGHSAGGHLTALCLDPDWQREAGLPAGCIRGGTAISGVFELEPLRLSAQQETLGFTPEEVAGLSPQRHIPPQAGPLVVAVGGAETQEFIDQSLEFAASWSAAGHPTEIHVVARANHIDILTGGLAQPGAPLHTAVLRQMKLA